MSYSQVGSCPKCGAPIYSPSVWHAVTPPPITYTCNCNSQSYYTCSSSSGVGLIDWRNSGAKQEDSTSEDWKPYQTNEIPFEENKVMGKIEICEQIKRLLDKLIKDK